MQEEEHKVAIVLFSNRLPVLDYCMRVTVFTLCSFGSNVHVRGLPTENGCAAQVVGITHAKVWAVFIRGFCRGVVLQSSFGLLLLSNPSIYTL
jgi:hypothetical protein